MKIVRERVEKGKSEMEDRQTFDLIMSGIYCKEQLSVNTHAHTHTHKYYTRC